MLENLKFVRKTRSNNLLHHHIVPSGSIHHFCFWPFWPPFWPLLKVGLDVVLVMGSNLEQHNLIWVGIFMRFSLMFSSGDMTRHQDVWIGIPHGFCQRLLKTAKISSKIANIWLFLWNPFLVALKSKFGKFGFNPTLTLLWFGY